MMPRPITAVMTLVSMLMLLSSCLKIPDPIIPKSTEEAVKDAASKLEAGMRGIDLVATKELLSRNDELRSQLDRVTALYTTAVVGPGLIVPANVRLRLVVRDWVGALSIDAWIDNPENWIYSNTPLPQRDYIPASQISCIGQTDGRFRGDKPFDQVIGWLTTCQSWWEAEVVRAIQSVPTPTTPGPQPRDLSAQLGTVGLHRVYVRFTPRAKGPKSGFWAATVELEVDPASGGPVQRLKEATVDSRVSHKGAPIDAPLPEIVMMIVVR